MQDTLSRHESQQNGSVDGIDKTTTVMTTMTKTDENADCNGRRRRGETNEDGSENDVDGVDDDDGDR